MENPSDNLHQIKTKICQKMWINCICHPLYPHTPTYWTTTSSSIYHHKGLVSMASRINLWNISQTEKFEGLCRIQHFILCQLSQSTTHPESAHGTCSVICGGHPIVVTTQKIVLETLNVADFGRWWSVGGDLANPPLYHVRTKLYRYC